MSCMHDNVKFNRLIEVLVLKKEIVRLRVFIQETWDYNPIDAS